MLRAACLALPGVEERTSHGAPAFFAGGQFAHLWVDGHHDDPAAQAWLAAPEGAQAALVAGNPVRWFVPPYVGHRGWVGVRLEGADPLQLEEAAEEAWRCVAPRRLVAEHDAAEHDATEHDAAERDAAQDDAAGGSPPR